MSLCVIGLSSSIVIDCISFYTLMCYLNYYSEWMCSAHLHLAVNSSAVQFIHTIPHSSVSIKCKVPDRCRACGVSSSVQSGSIGVRNQLASIKQSSSAFTPLKFNSIKTFIWPLCPKNTGIFFKLAMRNYNTFVFFHCDGTKCLYTTKFCNERIFKCNYN